MKRTRTNHLRTLFLGITMSALTLAACGGDSGLDPEEGNSYLTVVGDSNVFLDYGVQRVLTVRYHNSNDEALAGEVSFEIKGSAAGSTINTASAVTNSQGLAEVIVSTGSEATAFEIEATAAYANPAKWNVAVSAGTPPLALDGTYGLDSNFDVVSGLPGTLGDVVNTVIDMTDGANDPATFILDIAEDELGSPFDSLLSAARPGLDAVVNDLIKSNAPGLVNDLLEMGNNLGEVSRNFGTDSYINVTAGGVEGGNMVAAHTMTGFHFQIDNQTYTLPNTDLGVENVTIENIVVGTANGKMTMAAHNMPIQYGGFLAMALEDVIIPLIDPSASSLEQLLQNNINCASVGQAIANFIGFGSSSLYEGACGLAIEAGAESAIDALIDVDDSAQVVLQIAGEARVNDTTGDRKVDTLTQGKWTGSIEYVGSVGALGGENTFTGERR